MQTSRLIRSAVPKQQSSSRHFPAGAQYFLYGALDARNLEVLVMDLLGKHFGVRGYELFEITLAPKRLNKAAECITTAMNKGKLRPVISETFAFVDIQEAHKHMESNAQMGKIMVKTV